MFPLRAHTIFVSLAGSHAHGTARAGSDVDLRGVCVAPLPVRLSLFSSFEHYDGLLPDALAEDVLPRLRAHPTARDGLDVKIECVVFDIAKFVRLCTLANPNTLEVLFSDERDWVMHTAAWKRLHGHRHRFLTKKVQQTFLGYAMAQLKKIKTHRSWLLHPPQGKPERAAFGLPEAEGTLNRDDRSRIEQAVADKLRSYGVDDIEMPRPSRIAVRERLDGLVRDVLAAEGDDVEAPLRSVAAQALSLPPSVVAVLNAEKKYRAAMKHWESYQSWKLHRNRARAHLEQAHGYDTKHAMHLIRLMRMGLEVLRDGDLRVRRDDAAELSAIRDGGFSFDDLLAAATDLQQAMRDAMASTPLPDDVDHDFVDALARDLMLAED